MKQESALEEIAANQVLRKNAKTMIRRIKLVITSSNEGAKISRVITTTTLSDVTSCCGVSGALRVRFTVGTVGAPNA